MVRDVVWDLDLGGDGITSCDAGVARIERRVVDSFAFSAVVEALA